MNAEAMDGDCCTHAIEEAFTPGEVLVLRRTLRDPHVQRLIELSVVWVPNLNKLLGGSELRLYLMSAESVISKRGCLLSNLPCSVSFFILH